MLHLPVRYNCRKKRTRYYYIFFLYVKVLWNGLHEKTHCTYFSLIFSFFKAAYWNENSCNSFVTVYDGNVGKYLTKFLFNIYLSGFLKNCWQYNRRVSKTNICSFKSKLIKRVIWKKLLTRSIFPWIYLSSASYIKLYPLVNWLQCILAFRRSLFYTYNNKHFFLFNCYFGIFNLRTKVK